MKSVRRLASMLTVLPLAIAGLVASTGSAAAAVVVPPGAAGHTCSEYHYMTAQRYWQTCAWADYQYVWFTVNFGNTGQFDWHPSWVQVDYIKSGVDKLCAAGRWESKITVPAGSTYGTPRLSCVITRVPGAYASDARVTQDEIPYDQILHSPTLQVQ